MAEAAAAQTVTAGRAVKKEPWSQLAEENDLWYGRFLRFVAIGPKRSMSILTKGRPNAYPVPAHWPMQASQLKWRERATAFDDAARANPRVIQIFNDQLRTFALATSGKEGPALQAAALAGYHVPDPDDDGEEAADSAAQAN